MLKNKINLAYEKYDYSKKEIAEHTKIIKSMVRKCMNHLKKKEYELDITKYDVDKAVAVTKIINTKSAGATNACRNKIQINLSYWQHHNEKHFHKEYDSFNNDPHIGGRQCLNLDHAYLVSVSHEVAHHVQYAKAKYIKRFRGNYRKPHGDCFKAIYRYLRRDLINPIIDKDLLDDNQQTATLKTKEVLMQKNKTLISDDIVKQIAEQEQQHNVLKGSNKQNSSEMSAIRLDQYATAMIPINQIARTDTGNISEDATNELLTTFQVRCDMTKGQADLFKRNCVLFTNKHDLPKSNLTKTYIMDLFKKLDIKSQASLINHNKGDDVKSPLDTIIDKLVGLTTKTGKQRDGLIMTKKELEDFEIRLKNRFEIADKGRNAVKDAEAEQKVIDDVTDALLDAS